MISGYLFCDNSSVSVVVVSWLIHYNFLNSPLPIGFNSHCWLLPRFMISLGLQKGSTLILSFISQNLSIKKNILLWIILIIWKIVCTIKARQLFYFFLLLLFILLPFWGNYQALILTNIHKKVHTNQRNDIIQWISQGSRHVRIKGSHLFIAWCVAVGLYMWHFWYKQLLCGLKKYTLIMKFVSLKRNLILLFPSFLALSGALSSTFRHNIHS